MNSNGWRERLAGIVCDDVSVGLGYPAGVALLAAIFVINSVDYLFFYAPVHLAFWMAAAGLKPPEPTPVPPKGSAILTP